MDGTATVLARAEAADEDMRRLLEGSGLSLAEIEELVEEARRGLPPAERRRVEEAMRRVLPQERHRAGSSGLRLPVGIRG